MSIVLQSSGGGSVTLQEAVTASNLTITVPAVTGTMLTTASAGSVLQVVQGTYSTQAQISSTSYVDSGLSATITPTSSTSKILVIGSMAGDGFRNSNATLLTYQNIVRNSTQVTEKKGYFGGAVSSDGYFYNLHNTTLTFLDSPATTSPITYKVQARLDSTANDAYIRYQTNNSTSVMILMEISA
jgi:hypothetical protein